MIYHSRYTSNIGWRGEFDFQVTVCGNRRQFLEYIRAKDINGKQLSGRKAAAKMWAYDDETIEKFDEVFAELCFYVDHMNIDSVAHEVTHLLIANARRANVDLYLEMHEEMLAFGVGNLTDIIWRDWIARENNDGIRR